VKEYRRKWREHVERINEGRSKWAAKYTPTGSRDRGRPGRELEDTSATSQLDEIPQMDHVA